MTPEEAAICLRDDPTFATSSPAEQAEEAALLLGTDDPLDVAAVYAAAAAIEPLAVKAFAAFAVLGGAI